MTVSTSTVLHSSAFRMDGFTVWTYQDRFGWVWMGLDGTDGTDFNKFVP